METKSMYSFFRELINKYKKGYKTVTRSSRHLSWLQIPFDTKLLVQITGTKSVPASKLFRASDPCLPSFELLIISCTSTLSYSRWSLSHLPLVYTSSSTCSSVQWMAVSFTQVTKAETWVSFSNYQLLHFSQVFPLLSLESQEYIF